jgi:hypothetical protein
MADETKPTPTYERRLLVYFDILGWRDLVNRSVGDRAALERIERVLSPFDGVRPIFDRANSNGRLGQFSDHFVLSAPVSELKSVFTVVYGARVAAKWLLTDGCCTRGAIVAGDLVHRPDRIYGPALNEAHFIESKVARYPRIVLTPEALRVVERANMTAGDRPPHQTRRDADGLPYLDILSDFKKDAEVRPNAFKAIRDELEASRAHRPGDMEVEAKHGWVLTYLETLERELA